MSYVTSDTFIDIAIEHNNDPKKIIAHIQQHINPSFKGNVTAISNRIDNYKRKGLLPLDSGNKVDTGQFLKGTSTLYDATGRIKQQWVKTDVAKEDNLSAFKEAIETLTAALPAYTPLSSPEVSVDMEDLLTIYPIGDAHIGMLSHAEETGENNDLKLATSRLEAAMSLSVEQALPSSQAFIIDTGDFFHADDSSNSTPRGNNPLDVDGRFHKVLETGLYLAAKLVEQALTKHQTVHWRSAEGNHNPHTSIMISMFLKAYFRNEPRVIIHCSPSTYFYHRFGKCLLGITHGHTCKPDKLGELMAVDCNDIWSNTKHRYWYLGHVHHSQLKEYPSCVVETFRTLTPKDAWHSSMAYRSGQDLKTITLHKEYGEVSRNTISVQMIK